MPTTHRITALVTALVAVGGLVGCANESPQPSAAPDPTSAPVFASEEEALAAATEAYAAYLSMSDEISKEGGADPERIERYVLPDRASSEIDNFEDLQASGRRTTGESQFDSIRFQQYTASTSIGDSVTTYLCFDASEVVILDEAEQDVTPPDRIDRVPFEIEFVVNGVNPISLLLARSEVWTGQNFC